MSDLNFPLRALFHSFLLFQEVSSRKNHMLTSQIEQRFFAIEGELRNEPIPHNTVSVGLNAGSVGFQEVILPAILCAVGQRGNELLHLFIGQVLVGIAGRYIALLAGVAGWGAVCTPDNPQIGEIRTQLPDGLYASLLGLDIACSKAAVMVMVLATKSIL